MAENKPHSQEERGGKLNARRDVSSILQVHESFNLGQTHGEQRIGGSYCLKNIFSGVSSKCEVEDRLKSGQVYPKVRREQLNRNLDLSKKISKRTVLLPVN